MYVRLAFAVAAHLNPEVLVVDEVLAVGDASFQKKCLGKMQDTAGDGRTVLFVSHNMPAVQVLCARAVVLEGGRVTFEGPSDLACRFYLSQDRPGESPLSFERQTAHRSGSGEVRLTSVEIVESDGIGHSVPMGGGLTFRLGFMTRGRQSKCNFGISIRNMMDQIIFRLTTSDCIGDLPPLQGRGTIDCRIPRLPLLAGVYNVALSVKQSGQIVDHIRTAVELDVVAADLNGTGRIPSAGICHLPCEWRLGSVGDATQPKGAE